MSLLQLGRKHLANWSLVVLLAAWYVLLAPTNIGGPTDYVAVSGHSMDGTYQTGDLIITRQQDQYQVGDIITFKVHGGEVIHRIIGGNGESGYRTQGDNNPDPDPWYPTDEDVVGKSWVHLPGTAWVLHLPANPLFAGVAAGLVALLWMLLEERRDRRRGAARKPAEDGALCGAELVRH